jgi:glyoxylase-like metal-dependent hydrolase (beta-lactamase superfamily II)
MQVAGWKVSLLELGRLPMEAEKLAPAGALAGSEPIPVNGLLLSREGETVLVDSGSGPLTALWPGATDVGLPSGLAPDLVVLTHLDFDHLGGLVTESMEPVFPEARVVMAEGAGRIEPDLDRRRASRRAFEALEVEELPEGEIVPGVYLRSAPGHRAGHSIVEVEDELVHLADLVHHTLHVEHPEWDAATDDDPACALATRRAILAEVADRGVIVVGSHLPGPGRVERAGGVFRWSPVAPSR